MQLLSFVGAGVDGGRSRDEGCMRGDPFRYRCGSYANVSSLRCIYSSRQPAILFTLTSFTLRYSSRSASCRRSSSRVRRKRSMYLMVLPVLNRIHCGMGLFCFWALASFCLVRNDLWLYTGESHQRLSACINQLHRIISIAPSISSPSSNPSLFHNMVSRE
jgi:hypothetical protein